jgi:hypothetical protein
MKIIEAPFITDKNEDDNTGSHANGKANHIDRRIHLILPKVSPGCFEIVLDHINRLIIYKSNIQL